MSLFWTCPQGHKEWLHREYCGLCAAPAPVRDLPQHNPGPKFVRHNSTPPPAPPDPPTDPGYSYF